ncbi:PhzF family phenazine biosynthesis protein [Rufibacter immobilis]|uniref:PhzF family phenazine biosynthesis protein n=1 Tax=Rufibacter immobilis TaxID=1348778 RepID=A0A3M9MPL1_9BACT|nr:PhzF family phenazine biosynthesis protein [Rufibacter immobilis]RNI27460.1 PhzF family phenazine biosynthesis protein [Rufibacter immobilis]
MNVKTFIVDAFTRESFKGNPAGVCLLDQSLAEPQMQAIAAELNLSETAFLVPMQHQDATYSIRYFTPTVEIAFCGHATLASSKVVLEKQGLPQVTFVTQEQLVLSAFREEDAILMHFPLYPYAALAPLPMLLEALGLAGTYPLYFSEAIQMLVLEVPDKETLLQIKPDFARLLQLPISVNGLAVTAKSTDPGFDFYSRCFWPRVGINEDPVTGSAHSVLAKYWSDQLAKTELVAAQLSARGGQMQLTITGPNSLEVRSQAQIVLEGLLTLS